jgi:MSHA biogenesis protein MshG
VLVTKIALSRFFRMLAVMLSSGMQIVSALEITAGTADNVIVSSALADIHDGVVAGGSLSQNMREFDLFPPIAVRMLAIGEQTGELDSMLLKSADYFDEETDYAIANLMALLEPFLILLVAVLVMLLALGVFLPMWSVMNLYSGIITAEWCA